MALTDALARGVLCCCVGGADNLETWLIQEQIFLR